MSRTRLLLTAATLAIVAQETHAQSCGGRTIDQIVDACDSAFPGYNLLIYSARGWCYLINGTSCLS